MKEMYYPPKGMFNPVTGAGTPGMRSKIVLADFPGGQDMWIPAHMMRSSFFRALIDCGSLDNYVEKYFEGYDPDKSRMAVMRKYCRTRSKHDVYFFAGYALRRKGETPIVHSLTFSELQDVKVVHKMIFRQKLSKDKVLRYASRFKWFKVNLPRWFYQEGGEG